MGICAYRPNFTFIIDITGDHFALKTFCVPQGQITQTAQTVDGNPPGRSNMRNLHRFIRGNAQAQVILLAAAESRPSGYFYPHNPRRQYTLSAMPPSYRVTGIFHVAA